MFNLNDYELVEDRLREFWKENPDGRIETEMLEFRGDSVVIMARIFRTEADPKPWATGIAQECKADLGRMSKSFVEICETSAIGRALANAHYAAKGKRPSQSEMLKVAAKAEPVGHSDSTYQPEHREPAPIDPIGLVQDVLGASVVKTEIQAPHCHHGIMILREGTSKAGKPYKGYMCTEKLKSNQCKPKWFSQDNNGMWYLKAEGSELV